MENGKDVVINAPDNSDKNIYLDVMKLNGQEYTKNYLTHGDLMSGVNIDMKMSDEPNTQRGTLEEDLPYSFTKELATSKNQKKKK